MIAMPTHISGVIGIPTIRQCVCSPIRNIGPCASTPATISAQPAQNATG